MTKEAIAAMTPGQTIWDEVVKGLHLRAFKDKKVYYLFYRLHGIQRKPSIGEHGVISLDQARKLAKQMLAEATLGNDPRDSKRNAPIVKDVFEACYAEHWSKPKFSEAWQREVKRLFDKDIKGAFGNQRINRLKVEDVEQWHASYFDKPSVGNRALAVISKLFTFAQKKRWVPQGINPCQLIEKHEEQSRERYATPEEIRAIGMILEREANSNPRAVAFLYILMFTGSRPQAIEKATWNQLSVKMIDGKKFGVLKFDGKTGQEKVILPPPAMRVIDKLPRSLFGKILGIKMPVRFWRKVQKEVGCEDLWIRDWRRTFATVGMSNNQDMSTISQLLNHKSSQTTMIYAKLMDDAKLKSAAHIAASMEALLGGHSVENETG